VCWAQSFAKSQETVEPIAIPFLIQTRVRPKEPLPDEGVYIPHGKAKFYASFILDEI